MEHKEIVKVKAKLLASKRTKNRIKERGPIFNALSVQNHVWQFPGVDCLLIESLDGKWLGWLPINEITIEVVSEMV